MVSSHWQKQHTFFLGIVWGISAVISILLTILLLSLGLGREVASIFFIVVFAILRISSSFILNNRFANSMVRVLKFDYEEIERDFRLVFKEKYIQYYRKNEEDSYRYEFPGRGLTMTVQPHWITNDGTTPPATKVTLHKLTAKNEEFAKILAGSIDEMANKRANN